MYIINIVISNTWCRVLQKGGQRDCSFGAWASWVGRAGLSAEEHSPNLLPFKWSSVSWVREPRWGGRRVRRLWERLSTWRRVRWWMSGGRQTRQLWLRFNITRLYREPAIVAVLVSVTQCLEYRQTYVTIGKWRAGVWLRKSTWSCRYYSA